MRLNLDPPSCNMRPRPLFYYAITEGINGLYTPHKMRAHGFRHYVADGLGYWFHPGDGTAHATEVGRISSKHTKVTRTPIVFVHGVGLGPLPYLHFVEAMLDGSPLLVIELPFVAQRLSGSGERTALHQASTVAAIRRAMERHHLMAATFVGHSLGTVYLSWVAQLAPQLIASAVFIDPIVFLLHQPKVAQSFLYDKPHDARAAIGHYFIKSERTIVHYFHHHFDWQQNVLWTADLRATPTEVILARNDAIVPVEQVQAYLRRSRVRSTVLDGASHGDFLIDQEKRQQVLSIVRRAQARGMRRGRRFHLWRARRAADYARSRNLIPSIAEDDQSKDSHSGSKSSPSMLLLHQ